MADSLSSAMKSSGRKEEDRETKDDSSRSSDGSADQKVDIMSLMKEVWGVNVLSKEDLEKVSNGQKMVQQQQQQRTAPKNEAFEQMRRGFERRYDVEEREEKEERHGRPRDEL
jgi:hypothetical protein